MPDIRWRGQEHKTLYDWINSGPGPTASTPQLDYWNGLKQSLADISNKLNTTMHDIGASWEGVAGVSATSGLTPLQHWAEESLSSAELMSSSAQDQADNVATARAAMPAPQKMETGAVAPWQQQAAEEAAKKGDDGPAKAIAKQAADHEAQETAAADAHEQAIQVMSNYQSASEHNTATLGQFGNPPDLVVAVQLPNGQDSTSLDYAGLGSGQQHAQNIKDAQPGTNPAGQPLGGAPGGMHQQVAPLSTGAPAGGGTSAAAALGGVGAGLGVAGGLGVLRQFSRRGPQTGGTLGVGPSSAQAREDQERVRPVNARGVVEPQNAGRPGPGMVPPMAGGAGAGGGNNEQTRGGNRYLNNNIRPMGPGGNVGPEFGGHPAPLPQGGPGGGMPQQAPAPINQAGSIGMGPGGTGAAGTPGANAPFAGGPQVTGGPGGPTFGPPQGGGFGAGPGAMPGGGMPGGGMPPGGAAGGGAGMQDDQHETPSYLVEAVDVFDDGRMVAPSVLGGDEDQH